MSPFFLKPYRLVKLNLHLLYYLDELVFVVPEALTPTRWFFGPASVNLLKQAGSGGAIPSLADYSRDC